MAPDIEWKCTHELTVICLERAHDCLVDGTDPMPEFTEYWCVRGDYFLYVICRWCDTRTPLPHTWEYSPDAWLWEGDEMRLPGTIVIGSPLMTRS